LDCGEDMKITILGSSGQIGSYLTEYLRKKDYEVFEFDIVNGEHQDMTHIPNSYLRNAIMNCDFVFFLSFDVGGSHYLKKYQHTFNFIDNNARMMVNVFGLIEQYEKPFVFASSQMSSMSYSPYGVLKRVGELYTKSLQGLIVKFWNVYGIERDMEKAHVITDFIHKGFKTGKIDMMTDGKEQREFLYAEDCCEAMETILQNYDSFSSDDELHITTGASTSILEIAQHIQVLFKKINLEIDIVPNKSKDEVQKDARNISDPYIKKWWTPKTNIVDGLSKVFDQIKLEYS
jgi:nucleoside-diphosphate-sugar epimerase